MNRQSSIAAALGLLIGIAGPVHALDGAGVNLTVDPIVITAGETTTFTVGWSATGSFGSSGVCLGDDVASQCSMWNEEVSSFSYTLATGDGRSVSGEWAGSHAFAYGVPGSYQPSVSGLFGTWNNGTTITTWFEEVPNYRWVCNPDGGCHEIEDGTRLELRRSVEPFSGPGPSYEVSGVAELHVLSTPGAPLPPSSVDLSQRSFTFTFWAPGGGATGPFAYFDPPFAVGYRYRVDAGPNVTSVLVPTALPGGDADFTLSFDGQSHDLTAGVPFDVTPFASEGIAEFEISGISVDEQLEADDPMAFVLGATFAAEGNVTLTQTAMIPEPETWALAAVGLLLVALRTSRPR